LGSLLQSPRTHRTELGTLARFAALVAWFGLRQRVAKIPLLNRFIYRVGSAVVMDPIQRLLGGFA
jgi:hypothetical protein